MNLCGITGKLLLGKTSLEISGMQEKIAYGTLHSYGALKRTIAHEIIAKFWSPKAADDAQIRFEALFQDKRLYQSREIGLTKETLKILSG